MTIRQIELTKVSQNILQKYINIKLKMKLKTNNY